MTDNDQIGQLYRGWEEPKTCRIGHDALMEQDTKQMWLQIR